jgi:glycine/D-amino acid oxidase-like deaminating enzyme
VTKRVVICGGGAIGCAIAYFLSKRGAASVVIERHEVAGSASGKSGGFLARDWCRGTPLDRLARRSFDLHAELAAELGNPWGHRPLTTYGGYLAAKAGGGTQLSWLSDRVAITGRLGSTSTTAIVEPRAFTTGLLTASGAELKRGAVAGLEGTRVTLDNSETVEGDAVVIAMGPWSVLAARWLAMPAVYGFKGHSLIFRTGDTVPAEALFLEVQEAPNGQGAGEVLTPEIFPRADGTVWACAISSDDPLPLDPAHVRPDPGAHDRLEALCRRVSPALAAAPVVARQACFRPVTEDGVPLIGAVGNGVFVATGHSVWGMLNSPATGEAMAELILDGEAKHVDLAPFAPQRLDALDPARLGG